MEIARFGHADTQRNTTKPLGGEFSIRIAGQNQIGFGITIGVWSIDRGHFHRRSRHRIAVLVHYFPIDFNWRSEPLCKGGYQLEFTEGYTGESDK
jgi:hypothetical protein